MKSLAISERYGWPRYVAHQVYYSLIGRDYEWELMPLGIDQKVGALVWSPLGWGRLTGKIRRGQPRPKPPASIARSLPTPALKFDDEYLYQNRRRPRRRRQGNRQDPSRKFLSPGCYANPPSRPSSSARATRNNSNKILPPTSASPTPKSNPSTTLPPSRLPTPTGTSASPSPNATPSHLPLRRNISPPPIHPPAIPNPPLVRRAGAQERVRDLLPEKSAGHSHRF